MTNVTYICHLCRQEQFHSLIKFFFTLLEAGKAFVDIARGAILAVISIQGGAANVFRTNHGAGTEGEVGTVLVPLAQIKTRLKAE